MSFVKAPRACPASRRAENNTAASRAAMVVADSEHTRNDIVCLLDVPAERVEVLYCGVDPRFKRVQDEAELAAVRARYQLDRPFILAVGLIEPRKNLMRLIEAYYQLRERNRVPHELVIAGGRGWLSDSVFKTVDQLRLTAMVRFLGYVPPAIFAALIVPALFAPSGSVEVGAALYAGLFGVLVAWRSRNMAITIIAGLAAFALLRAVGVA